MFEFPSGQINHGRKELMKQSMHGPFGSINAFEHITICEQSHHVAFGQCTKPPAGGDHVLMSHPSEGAAILKERHKRSTSIPGRNVMARPRYLPRGDR